MEQIIVQNFPNMAKARSIKIQDIAKLWKDEWIKMWYTQAHVHTPKHTQEYYAAIKRNGILPFAMM